MLQNNVTVPKILEEQEFGVISPSIFLLSLSFLENKEFKRPWSIIVQSIDYCHGQQEEIQLK